MNKNRILWREYLEAIWEALKLEGGWWLLLGEVRRFGKWKLLQVLTSSQCRSLPSGPALACTHTIHIQSSRPGSGQERGEERKEGRDTILWPHWLECTSISGPGWKEVNLKTVNKWSTFYCYYQHCHTSIISVWQSVIFVKLTRSDCWTNMDDTTCDLAIGVRPTGF